MTEPPEDRVDPTLAADRLTEEMGSWREESRQLREVLAQQGSYGRNNRRAIWALVISLLIDVTLSIAVAIALVGVAHANSKSDRNREIAVARCRAGNDTRAQYRDLFEFIIDASRAANPHPSPAQAQTLHEFQVKVDQATLPVDCDRLSPSGAPTITTSGPSSPR